MKRILMLSAVISSANLMYGMETFKQITSGIHAAQNYINGKHNDNCMTGILQFSNRAITSQSPVKNGYFNKITKEHHDLTTDNFKAIVERKFYEPVITFDGKNHFYDHSTHSFYHALANAQFVVAQAEPWKVNPLLIGREEKANDAQTKHRVVIHAKPILAGLLYAGAAKNLDKEQLDMIAQANQNYFYQFANNKYPKAIHEKNERLAAQRAQINLMSTQLQETQNRFETLAEEMDNEINDQRDINSKQYLKICTQKTKIKGLKVKNRDETEKLSRELSLTRILGFAGFTGWIYAFRTPIANAFKSGFSTASRSFKTLITSYSKDQHKNT